MQMRISWRSRNKICLNQEMDPNIWFGIICKASKNNNLTLINWLFCLLRWFYCQILWFIFIFFEQTQFSSQRHSYFFRRHSKKTEMKYSFHYWIPFSNFFLKLSFYVVLSIRFFLKSWKRVRFSQVLYETNF
jgi:hypothetical protein